MAILIDVDEDQHEVMCSECEMIYSVTWRNNGLFREISFCPFCGDELEYEIDEDTAPPEGA